MSIADKLNTIAENEQKVYEAGKKSQYDEFWDIYQNYGNRIDYRYAFGNGGASLGDRVWNENMFKPKYDIVPTYSVDRMFGFNPIENLESHLDSLGVKLDTSKCTNMSYMFLNAQNKILPTISLESASSCANLFGYAPLLTEIRSVIFSETNTSYASAFQSCSSLVTMKAEGTIPVSISFSSSPLDKESIISVVNALSGNASGQTVTFKKTAKEAAFTTDEWNTLIAAKTNWTFSLV